MMKITLFVTGGTFDKEYDEINGKMYFKDSHLPDVLRMGRSKLNINIRTLMMIDSLEMTDTDRDLIGIHCKRCQDEQIIITHGTDTMVQTAQFLNKLEIAKTIVLTGAMIPYKFGSSDGLFNMGNALGFVQALNPGVYVAMQGRYFNSDNVVKNRKTGYFEELNLVDT